MGTESVISKDRMKLSFTNESSIDVNSPIKYIQTGIQIPISVFFFFHFIFHKIQNQFFFFLNIDWEKNKILY